MRIVYPNGEGIKNKRTLIHVMKKKLMNGRLEIPEGWQDLQKKKKETTITIKNPKIMQTR